MRYVDALSFLYGLESRGVRLGLERVREALKRRGNPHRSLKFVHVGGTNGKGSTSAILESCLRSGGYRTGLYTSPHLHRFVERIRIDGCPVSEREVAYRVTELSDFLNGRTAPALSFFETTTLLALEAFRDARCDIVVLEVGLGGRLDATNVVTPLCSVITRVERDHTRQLGSSLAAIAYEKAGIVKSRVPVVLGDNRPPIRRVIGEVARSKRSKMYLAQRDFSYQTDASGAGFSVRTRTHTLAQLKSPLLGDHQLTNTACGVMALEVLERRGFPVDEKAIRRGVRSVRWPGRLELVRGRPDWLFDAAHNPDGCRALSAYLQQEFANRRKVLLFAAMSDKDVRAMLQPLVAAVDASVFVALDMPRAMAPHTIARIASGSTAKNADEAIAAGKRLAGAEGLVVVAGSIFWVAEARARILGIRHDRPIPL